MNHGAGDTPAQDQTPSAAQPTPESTTPNAPSTPTAPPPDGTASPASFPDLAAVPPSAHPPVADAPDADPSATDAPDAGPSAADASRRVRRRRQRRAFQLLCLAVVLFFAPVTVVRFSGDTGVRSIAGVPAEPVGIVFGAAEEDGQPSPYLASRLDVAVALWHAGKIKVFLLSGDKQGADYDEPLAMRNYLLRRGVPADLIVMDGAGYDTWQTCIRAKQVYGVTAAIAISQTFHVPRAVYLCRAAGITTYGVGDGATAYVMSRSGYVACSAREVLAGFNAVYQGAFQPAPQVAGPPNNAVRQALAAAAREPGTPD